MMLFNLVQTYLTAWSHIPEDYDYEQLRNYWNILKFLQAGTQIKPRGHAVA
jgi:hypothetical protein